VDGLAGTVATGGRLDVMGAIGQMGEPTATPVSEVPRATAPLTGNDAPYEISWNGSDADGVDAYEVEVAVDGAPYAPVTLGSQPDTSSAVLLHHGSSYAYRVRALDPFANASEWTLTPMFRSLVREERWGAIAYSGPWTTMESAAAHGGKLRMASRSARATMTLPAGTRSVGIVAMTGPKEGRAQVWLDGVRMATLDLYRSTFRAQRIVYAAHLDAGSHVVQLRVLGRKNPDSTSTRVRFDAVTLTVTTP
jgi:hypothetical protein